MNVVNRIFALLLFVCIFVVGLFAVLYGFQWLGYSIYKLPGQAQASSFYNGLRAWVRSIEAGAPGVITWIALIALIILGLILLFLELRRPRPRYVRLGNQTYITKGAIADEAEKVAMSAPDISEARAKVKARRGPGADITINSKVRRGADLQSTRQSMQDIVEERLLGIGVPVKQLKVNTEFTDPRESRVRVR